MEVKEKKKTKSDLGLPFTLMLIVKKLEKEKCFQYQQSWGLGHSIIANSVFYVWIKAEKGAYIPPVLYVPF